MVMGAEATPWQAEFGEAVVTDAGGGALSWIARMAPELVPSQYSWKVQTVMSSFGSTSLCEKSPQRLRPAPSVRLPYPEELTKAEVMAWVVPSVSVRSRPDAAQLGKSTVALAYVEPSAMCPCPVMTTLGMMN